MAEIAEEEFVLIVPLWNWNISVLPQVTIDNVVLIVPLWNWNTIARDGKVLEICFNRTFMELKSQKGLSSDEEGSF